MSEAKIEILSPDIEIFSTQPLSKIQNDKKPQHLYIIHTDSKENGKSRWLTKALMIKLK